MLFRSLHRGNKWFPILLCLLSCVLSVHAQTVITGKITDNKGEPLIGATVIVKDNPQNGAISDIDGNYSLRSETNLIPKETKLIYSYIGFKNKQVVYNGNNTIQVKMEDDSRQLDDVVVTALGIKREEKGLGYSTQTVKGEDIMSTMPFNGSSAFEGNVAGAMISAAGGPWGSTKRSPRGDVPVNQDANGAF